MHLNGFEEKIFGETSVSSRWHSCGVKATVLASRSAASTPHEWRWQPGLRLITQALIWSERGERVTVPVVNKSSQLLLLIITVITLIIFNSAPRYEAVSQRTHL